MNLPQRFLAIDEEGYALSGDVRVTEVSAGHEILAGLRFAENGALQSTYGGTEVLIEAFDDALVARQVDVENGKWTLTFPYDFQAAFKPENLRLDEWDRFHGHTEAGIPFVLSRPAQAAFFDLIDDSDDESITIAGKTHVLPPLFQKPGVETPTEWSQVYQQGNPSWNLDQPAEALKDMLPRLRLPKCRILVPACGYGHDAAHFAQEGHVVTAVDVSPDAIQGAKARYGHLSNLNFIEGDIFKLGPEHRSAYDLVFEHTCYCAINPRDRRALVAKWSEWLSPNGQLMGVFFTMDKPAGPPFGGTEWELRERLRKRYRFLFWGRWRKSIPGRQGKELFVFASKLESAPT